MKRMRLTPLATAAVLALALLSGCAAAPGVMMRGEAPSMSPGEQSSPDASLPLVEGQVADGAESAPSSTGVDGGVVGGQLQGKSVISSAEVWVEAAKPQRAAEQIAEATIKLGGSVEAASERRATTDSPAGAELTLRVPPEKLEETLAALGKAGTISSLSRTDQDVTTQHVDLQARVQALEASITRLTDLMAGAATTGELIEAEGALTFRQQELDGLRAQLESLEGQVQEATIRVQILAPTVVPGIAPGSFWEGLLTGISSLGAAGSGALVLLGILLPWILVACVVAAAIVLPIRARRSRRARAQRHDDQTPMPL